MADAQTKRDASWPAGTICYINDKQWIEASGVLNQINEASALIGKSITNLTFKSVKDPLIDAHACSTEAYVSNYGVGRLPDSVSETVRLHPENISQEIDEYLSQESNDGEFSEEEIQQLMRRPGHIFGLLPEIGYVWQAVGKQLFLHKAYGHDNNYKAELFPEDVTFVAVAKPSISSFKKFGFILFVSTAKKIYVLTIDTSHQLAQLTPWPNYNVDISNVKFTCYGSTNSGRIFLGGDDGRLYEITVGDDYGMFFRNSQKASYSAGIFETSPLRQIVVDEERNLLYSLSDSSVVCMFYLGWDGKLSPKLLALKPLKKLLGMAKLDPTLSILHLSPSPEAESRSVQLIATLSDSRRLLISVEEKSPSGFNSLNYSVFGRLRSKGKKSSVPSNLRVVSERASPLGVLGSGSAIESLRISAAMASAGLLVSVQEETVREAVLSRVVVCYKDSSLLPAELAGGPERHWAEVVSKGTVGGKVLGICEVLPAAGLIENAESLFGYLKHKGEGTDLSRAKRLWAYGTFHTQYLLPRRQFLVITSEQAVTYSLKRPVDIMAEILGLETVPPSSVKEFLARFGVEESMAICYAIASGILRPLGTDGKWASVQRAACAVIEDPRLGGLARVETRQRKGADHLGYFGVEESIWIASGKEQGLRLICCRLFQAVWEQPLINFERESDKKLPQERFEDDSVEVKGLRFPAVVYKTIKHHVDLLQEFLLSRRTPEHKKLNFSRDSDMARQTRRRLDNDDEFLHQEPHRMESLRRLLKRTSEAITILKLVGSEGIIAAASRMDKQELSGFCRLSFESLVGTAAGTAMASKLLFHYFSAAHPPNVLERAREILRKNAASFYTRSDDEFFKGISLMSEAVQHADSNPLYTRQRASEAHKVLRKVPEVPRMIDAIKLFRELRHYPAMADLALLRARAVDPNEDALNTLISSEARSKALESRSQYYSIIFDCMRDLKNPKEGSKMNKEDGEYFLNILVHYCGRSDDKVFFPKLLDVMKEFGIEDDIPLLFSDLLELHLMAKIGPEFFDKTGTMITSEAPIEKVKVDLLQHLATYLLRKARKEKRMDAYYLAAAIYLRLGMRNASPKEVLLSERIDLLDKAKRFFNVDSGNCGNFWKIVTTNLSLFKFQEKAREELLRMAKSFSSLDDTSGKAEALTADAEALWTEKKEAQEFYDNYLVKHRLTKIKSEMEFEFNFCQKNQPVSVFGTAKKKSPVAAAFPESSALGGSNGFRFQ